MTPDAFNLITRENVLAAIAEIDRDGVRSGRQSSTYDLLHGGRKYPPKYVLSLAARYATGKELEPEEFEGGIGTPAFRLLSRLDFDIVGKTTGLHIQDDRWAFRQMMENRDQRYWLLKVSN